MAHTEEQAIKGPKNDKGKTIQKENLTVYSIQKQETRNTYEPQQQKTTTEHQIPDLGQVQTIYMFKSTSFKDPFN